MTITKAEGEVTGGRAEYVWGHHKKGVILWSTAGWDMLREEAKEFLEALEGAEG